jgi:hypothetical protein
LLSSQQAAGNRAVAGLIKRWREGSSDAGLSAVVQRRVGFEFELNAPLYHEAAGEDIFGNRKKTPTNFGKTLKLHNQEEFHIVQDHAAADVDGVNTIPEFVIHPQEESLPREAFLANVKAAAVFVTAIENQKYPFAGTLKIDTTPPAFVSNLTTSRQGGAQATYGLLPEGILTLFSDKKQRLTERSLLFEDEILARARSAAERVVEHPAFNDSKEKLKIQGFLALVCMYCVSNSIQALQEGRALDKNKVPFLVRSTMGEIARKTLSEDSRDRLAKNVVELAELILGQTKANSGNPIISPTTAERKKVPNVPAGTWVTAALTGTDEPLKWGSLQPGEDSALIGPERVGTRVRGDSETGDDRGFGAVLEERNLVQGEVPVRNWVATAEKTWEYVRQANQIK